MLGRRLERAAAEAAQPGATPVFVVTHDALSFMLVVTLEHAKFSRWSWAVVVIWILSLFAPLWRPRLERYFWAAGAAAWGWWLRQWR